MASFVVDNNVESLVADDPLTSGAVTLNVNTGHGARFPSTFPYRLTIWDDSTYPDPTDDSNMEVVNCTGRSTDALTIARGEEGTSGVEHALGSRVALLFTAGLFNDATYGVTTKLDTIETNADVTGDNPPQTHAMSTHTDEGALSTLNTVDTAQIDDDAVLYAKFQNIVNDERILGRVSGADGIVEELTAAQVLTMINVEAAADVTDTTNVNSAGAVMESDISDQSFTNLLKNGDFESWSAGVSSAPAGWTYTQDGSGGGVERIADTCAETADYIRVLAIGK